MRKNSWTAFLALFAVLFHTSFVAHHISASLADKFARASLAAALGVICHGGGNTEVPVSNPQSLPEPDKAGNFCPLCAGLAPIFADLGATDFDISRPDFVSIRVAVRNDVIRVRIAPLFALPRGPPHVG